MKILNQHIKSLKPRDGAESTGVPLWFEGSIYYTSDFYYHRKIVCWADEARLFNCTLINTGTEAATVYFRVMPANGTPYSKTTSISLSAGEERVFFPKKQIVLKKDEYLDLYSDKTTVSLFVNCYYLSGYDWFRVRADFMAGQMEGVEAGKIKVSSLSSQAETRNKGPLFMSQLSAQAEGINKDGFLAAWLGVQTEYNEKNIILDAVASAQIEFTGTVESVPITVGADKTFQTIQEAVDAAPEGSAIHIYPGTYEESVSINKLLHLIGEGASPTDVKIKIGDHGLAYTISDNGESPTIILDNLTVEIAATWHRALFIDSTNFPALTVEAYNCLLDCTGASAYPVGMDNSNITLNLYNCTLFKGYSHIVNYDAGAVNFHKVEINGTLEYTHSDKTIVNDDYVNEPTQDYGYEYELYSYSL